MRKREDREPAPEPTAADPDPIRSMSDREKLQLRTWLLHWSLFAYGGPPETTTGEKW